MDARPPVPLGTAGVDAARRAAELARRYAYLDGAPLLRRMVEREFPGRLAVVSSFGTESAVLLAMVADVDPGLPVIFLDTGKHFAETLRYRDTLVDHLGLRNVHDVGPDAAALARADSGGDLWRRNPDGCCHLRKVMPLQPALAGYDAWITGRKRYQGGLRGRLPAIEAADGRVKINPLAPWPLKRIQAAFEARGLPRHPLESLGYLSVGCVPCTRPVAPDADPRAGRWSDLAKTECGIHFPTGAAG